MNNSEKKNWLITGASKGLGLELTKHLLENGDKAIVTTRHRDKYDKSLLEHPNLDVYELDLTDDDAIKVFIEKITLKPDPIDVLVNNAGYGFIGAIEETSLAEIEKVLRINLLSGINLIKKMLPHMRAQGSGHIINMSSMAGLKGSAGWGVYNMGKFAVEGYTEALFEELKPFNIHVSLVEPGAFRTNFLDSSLQSSDVVLPEYDETVGKRRNKLKHNNGQQPNDPVKAAQLIFDLAHLEHPPFRVLLGKDAYRLAHVKMDWMEKDFEKMKDWTFNTEF